MLKGTLGYCRGADVAGADLRHRNAPDLELPHEKHGTRDLLPLVRPQLAQYSACFHFKSRKDYSRSARGVMLSQGKVRRWLQRGQMIARGHQFSEGLGPPDALEYR